MAKPKTIYICSQCAYETPKWQGKCPNCSAWNSFEEVSRSVSPQGVKTAGSIEFKAIDEIDYDSDIRYGTGVSELDRVLGGGLVLGSLVLLGGDPGIGKSTLLLQICEYFGKEHTVLYISGEESQRQIKLRAERLGVKSPNLYLASSTDCEAVVDTVVKNKPEIVIIDSIQTMAISGVSSSPGSIVQVRECSNLFMRMAKSESIPVFLVGHVNKDGAIAGPKVMEHIVDTVLYFEGDQNMSYRILRCVKNRYGSTNEIGVFEMLDKGLKEVKNPSEMLISGRPEGVSGTCIFCAMEGTRPILVEVQALVTKTSFGTPRRMASGFDYNRLSMIIAVLEKRTGFFFGNLDVYVNVVGGLKLDEPAADLAIALALFSGICDKPLGEDIFAAGEIGLAGEIRNISHINERIKEGARLGFKRCIVPKNALKQISESVSDNTDMKIIGVNSLKYGFKMVSTGE